MTDAELKELVASLAVAQRETDRQLKETDEQVKATSRELQEFRRTDAEANQKLRESIEELKKQTGGLGNKFGDFAEGMALPSLIEILAKRFDVEHFMETPLARKGAEELELDLLGWTNGHQKKVVVAEVKSNLNQRELDKFLRNLHRVFEFFPLFRGYKLYGVIAAVKSRNEMDAAALGKGIAVARMHGEVFRLKEAPNFRPRDFSN